MSLHISVHTVWHMPLKLAALTLHEFNPPLRAKLLPKEERMDVNQRNGVGLASRVCVRLV